jgi:hypothetical protein
VFLGFGQAKFAYGGEVLGSSQFLLLLKCLKKQRSIQMSSRFFNHVVDQEKASD